MTPRPLTSSDIGAVSGLLERAFASGEAVHYDPAVLAFLAGELWVGLPASCVVTRDSRPIGVALAGPRSLRLGAEPLSALHIGPVGVEPEAWGEGVGTALMQSIEQEGLRRGMDLLTLTARARGDAQRMYRRLGYAVIERYRPIAHTMTDDVRPAPALTRWPPGPTTPPTGRQDALVETGGWPRRVPESLRPRVVHRGGRSVWTIRWPVQAEHADEVLYSAQILAISGEGPLQPALDAARAAAVAEGCAVIWCQPGVATALPGYTQLDNPEVVRMVKPLSERGARLCRLARAYDEWGPAS